MLLAILKNKPINTEEELTRFKKWSLIIVFIYCVVIIIMMQFEKSYLLVLPMIIGMMEQAFTITPWGYGFIHWVDNTLGSFKRSKQEDV